MAPRTAKTLATFPAYFPRLVELSEKLRLFHCQVHDPMKAAQGYNQRVDLWSLGVVTLPAEKTGREKSLEQSASCKHLQTVETNARQWNQNTCRTENYDPRPRQKGFGHSDHTFLVFSQSSCWVHTAPYKIVWFWLSYSNLTWPHFHDYLVDQKGILGNSWAHVVYSQVGEIWKILQLTSIHPYLKQLDWLDGARKGSKRKIFCCCMARCSMSCWWAPIPLMVSEIQSMHKFETPLQVRWNWWTFGHFRSKVSSWSNKKFFYFLKSEGIENSVNEFKRASTLLFQDVSSSVRGFLRTGQCVLPWQPQVPRQWESIVNIRIYQLSIIMMIGKSFRESWVINRIRV